MTTDTTFNDKSDMNTALSAYVSVKIKKDATIFGPGTARLLRAIDCFSSVRNAAKSMDLSYSKAWKMINTTEEELQMPLVERRHGGKDGGSASLSHYGKNLLEKYERFNGDIQLYANKVFEQYFR